MERKPEGSHLILSMIVVLMYFVGCDNPFDEGTSSQPDFEAGATGFNDTTDVFIEINASRDSGDVSGDGVVIIGQEQFTLDVIDAILSTDFGMEDPIPQTDNLLVGVDFVCTPAFAELTVVLSPGDSVTTIRLNECEKDNPDEFEEGRVIINPCTGEEVTDIEQFRGVCIAEQFGGESFQDSTVLNEFNGHCASDDPCVVPIDVGIFVSALQ